MYGTILEITREFYKILYSSDLQSDILYYLYNWNRQERGWGNGGVGGEKRCV